MRFLQHGRLLFLSHQHRRCLRWSLRHRHRLIEQATRVAPEVQDEALGPGPPQPGARAHDGIAHIGRGGGIEEGQVVAGVVALGAELLAMTGRPPANAGPGSCPGLNPGLS